MCVVVLDVADADVEVVEGGRGGRGRGSVCVRAKDRAVEEGTFGAGKGEAVGGLGETDVA